MAATEGGEARKQAQAPLLVPSSHPYPSTKSLLPRMPGGTSTGIFPGDCLICQTFAVSPTKPEDYPLLAYPVRLL